MTAPAPPPLPPANIPRHIAIIMDGNGRWARHHNLARAEGHREGAENVLRILEIVRQYQIKYLTLYAFSVENWQRPEAEVEALMQLLAQFLLQHAHKLNENNTRLRTIGNIDVLPAHARDLLKEVVNATAHNNATTLVLALNYGARTEVLNAVRTCIREAQAGRLDAQTLDWPAFARYLDTGGIPDPDLIIRTSGETRLSNFLLLQAAYAEMYFSPALWPDFNGAHLAQAIHAYASRERRFGKTAEQLGKHKPAPPLT
jgi:undecaprenyl diphosphate synthase